ncbi:diiron oxygenase, partial [Nocardia asteroides]
MTLSTAKQPGDPGYHEILRSLSEGSVTKHFDPYVDIDWDAPEFAVHADDPRWIMPEEDPL